MISIGGFRQKARIDRHRNFLDIEDLITYSLFQDLKKVQITASVARRIDV